MRRLLQLAAKLYPRAWRERYGVEFDALMEDVEPSFREVLNVLGCAFAGHLGNGAFYLKLAAVMALIGAILGGVVSLGVPRRYVSTAVLRISSDTGSAQAINRMSEMTTGLLSCSGLMKLIEALDLYKNERTSMPAEDIVGMASRDLKISLAQPRQQDRTGATFLISFSYPEKDKAREVVRRLAEQFRDEGAATNRVRQVQWQILRRDLDAKGVHMASGEASPTGEKIDLLEPLGLPSTFPPNRRVFVAWGLGAGLLLGIVTASAKRRPKWTMTVAAFGVTGLGLAAGVSFLIPNFYVSTALMEVAPPLDAKRWYGERGVVPLGETVMRIASQIASPTNLEQLGRKWGVDQLTKQKIMIEPVGVPPAITAFRIHFGCNDRFKAQAIVNELTTQFAEVYAAEQRQRATNADVEFAVMQEHGFGERLLELDPPTMPQVPVYPNRPNIAVAGLIGGMLLGAAVLRIRASDQGRKPV